MERRTINICRTSSQASCSRYLAQGLGDAVIHECSKAEDAPAVELVEPSCSQMGDTSFSSEAEAGDRDSSSSDLE